jgi:hypothetical protein
MSCTPPPETEASQSHQESANQFNSIEKTEENSTPLPTKRGKDSPKKVSTGVGSASSLQVPMLKQQPPSLDESSDEDDDDEEKDEDTSSQTVDNSQATLGATKKNVYGSKGALHSPIGSAHSFDLQVSPTFLWNVKFYDCFSFFFVIFFCQEGQLFFLFSFSIHYFSSLLTNKNI